MRKEEMAAKTPISGGAFLIEQRVPEEVFAPSATRSAARGERIFRVQDGRPLEPDA